jgi:cell wall-associated NlpC family hydrolase
LISPANNIARSGSTPAVSDAMRLPDRAMMFAGDINRLIGSQPLTATSVQPASGSRIQNLLQHALALLGTPYRWGGTGADGFDCSGLVGYVFHSALGIDLPRVSREMATSGQLISDRANLSPGDLVFFGHRGRVSHVGIYVGEGRFLHAPSTGKDVMVSSLDNGYWSGKYMEARRVAGI